MLSYKDVFVKEFNYAVKHCPRIFYTVRDIPLPERLQTFQEPDDLYKVINIEEDQFLPLEGSVVVKETNRNLTKKSYNRYGDIVTVTEDISIPGGSSLILSDICLDIPYKYIPENEGYSAIGLQPSGKYAYIVPKECLTKVPMYAFTVSNRALRAIHASRVITLDYSPVYVSIIPWNPNRTYLDTRVLKVTPFTNYESEIEELFNYWELVGFIKNRADFTYDGDCFLINIIDRGLVEPGEVMMSEDEWGSLTHQATDIPDDPYSDTHDDPYSSESDDYEDKDEWGFVDPDTL